MTVQNVTIGLSDTLYQQVKQRARRMQRSIEEARNKLALEKAARMAVLANLEQRATRSEAELLAKQEEFRNLQSEHSTAVQTIATYQENIR